MIFYYSSSGTLIKQCPESVYQGSNNASVIYFVAPFAATNTVTANFTLANGEATNLQMLKLDTLGGVIDENAVDYTVWSIKLKNNITAYCGTVYVQFEIFQASGNEGESETTLTTQLASFTIEKGVAPILSEIPMQSTYEQILAALNTQIENLNSIEESSSISSVSIDEDEISYKINANFNYKVGNETSTKAIEETKKIPLSVGDNIVLEKNEESGKLILSLDSNFANKKLDKIEETDTDCKVYAVNTLGEQISTIYNATPKANSLVLRNSAGGIFSACVMTQIIDGQSNIQNFGWLNKWKSIFKHTATYEIGDESGHKCYLCGTFYSLTSEPIETEEEFFSANFDYLQTYDNNGLQFINVNNISIDKETKIISIYCNIIGNIYSACGFPTYEYGLDETEPIISDVVTRLI